MKSQLWYFSLRTVGCFQSCWRIRMPFIQGQTANFPAFDHDFRCFIVSAIICHSQHPLGFLWSDAISDQKWNAKLLRLHGKQKWQGTQGYSSQSLSNMHNAPKKTVLSHESQHKSQITAAQSQGSGAQLAGSPHPLRHSHVAHHSSDQKIADLLLHEAGVMHSKWKDAWCVDDVWRCTMDTDLMNFFGDKLSSHSAAPQFDPEKYPTSMVSWSACWMLHAWVSMSFSLAYKRFLRWLHWCQTQLMTLKHRVRLFKPIIFSLKMESLSVTEIPSTKIGRMESATHLYKGLLIQGWPTYQKASGSSDSRTSDTPWDKRYKVKLPPRSWER